MTEVSQRSLDALILHDVRYALGRQTWVPLECAQRVMRFWPDLSPERRVIVERDVREYVAKWSDSDGCGIDHSWAALLVWIDAQPEA
jgi:hypothetical protein